MSTVKEIEAAIPKLSRAEIAAGQYTTRLPKYGRGFRAPSLVAPNSNCESVITVCCTNSM